MTKQLIATICILGLVGMVVGVVAKADETVTATVTPQIISGIIKNKKRPILTVNYAYINRNSSITSMSARNLQYYNIFESLPGNDAYDGIYEYYNRSR